MLTELWRTHFGGRPGLFLDLGANVGYASLYLQRSLDVQRIIGVEPDLANFRVLEENLGMNGMVAAEARNVGVWSENTFLEYKSEVDLNSTWALSFAACDHDTGIYAINFFELAWSAIGDTHLDIMKMDIEGAESALFARPELMKQVLARTRIIGIEIHEHAADRKVIEGMLYDLGFELIHFGDMTFGANMRLVKNKILA